MSISKKRVVQVVILTPIVGILLVSMLFIWYSIGLPKIEKLSDYQPQLTSRVYSNDGKLVAEYFQQRRVEISINEMPDYLVKAFLAAEDADFYKHEGLDYIAIARAMIKNILSSGRKQGASTITQQTVKTMVVGPERSYARKIKEAILSKRLEDLLSKEDILHLYLNQIYFGRGNYGVEQASQYYLGKSAKHVALHEAVLLAAIPKHPERYNTLDDPEGVVNRRDWILGQMLKQGWISDQQMANAQKAKITTFQDCFGEKYPYYPGCRCSKRIGAYYAEHIRKDLEEQFGMELLFSGGLKIYSVMNANQQLYADNAVQKGLEEIAKRQGWSGPLWRIEVDQYKQAYTALHNALDHRLMGWRTFYNEIPEFAGRPVWDLESIAFDELDEDSSIKKHLKLKPLFVGQRYLALVTEVDNRSKTATLDLGTITATIHLEDISWARPYAPTNHTRAPRTMGTVLSKGDVVAVRVKKHSKEKLSKKHFEQKTQDFAPPPIAKRNWEEKIELELVPSPKVNGAMIAMDPTRGWITALVGGYDAKGTGFNRALQAKRQPGSAFKPIVYATALGEKIITPADLCPDTPIIIRDPWTGKDWRPENYEDGKFDGDIRYRVALAKSKNTCSVKLMERLGPKKVIEVAQKMGISSQLPENLTLALGTGEITPLELVNAYATLANGGVRAKPIMIRKVVDRQGGVLMEQNPYYEKAIEPATAYLVTSMMESVVQEGTAIRAKQLDRQVAGKTGTTNKSRSAWFGGFVPQLAAVVYTGFDDNASMGRETGGRAALPIWLDFMKKSLDEFEKMDFPIPPEIVFANISPTSGKLSNTEGAIKEAFWEGTEPTMAESEGTGDIFHDDDEL